MQESTRHRKILAKHRKVLDTGSMIIIIPERELHHQGRSELKELSDPSSNSKSSGLKLLKLRLPN